MRNFRKATLEDTLAIAAELDRADHLLTWEDVEYLREMEAEQYAEGAWLRAAESAGWEEIAWLERFAPLAI